MARALWPTRLVDSFLLWEATVIDHCTAHADNAVAQTFTPQVPRQPNH
jgi:hypothetical protein